MLRAVLAGWNVVNLESDHARILPPRAVVHEEADVFGRSGHAEVAAIAIRKLDRDSRFQKLCLRVVAYAGELLVLRILNELLDRLIWALGEITEVVWVLDDQPSELG